jgi:sugar (pentulose or hexulose) kinase
LAAHDQWLAPIGGGEPVSVAVGIDVGSRSARVVAIDRGGALVGYAETDYDRQPDRMTGRADPQCWRRGAETALRRLVARCRAAASPAAVAVGGQSPTAVPAHGLAVTYSYAEGIDGGIAAQQVAQCQLLKSEQPGGEVSQLWDWMLASLGAPRVQGRWPGDAPLGEFGQSVTTGTVVGKADGSGGVPRGTPLVAGAPDALLAFWAAGLDEVRRACDPGGRTGGLVVAVRDVDLAPGLMQMASPARGCSMVGGPVSAHGASLDWLTTVTGCPRSALLELAAGVPAGARGVIFLPYLEGERSPRWQRRLTGEFHGLRADTGPGELARAVLEGTAYGLAHIGRALRGKGAEIDVVTCAGGPSRSRLWCEIKAAVLGADFDVPEFSELSAYGAALAAGAGAGWWPEPGSGGPGSWPRPPMTRIDSVPRQVYQEGFERFVSLGDAAQQRL